MPLNVSRVKCFLRKCALRLVGKDGWVKGLAAEPKDQSPSPRSHKSMEKRISSHKPAGASTSLCLGYSETTKLDRPTGRKKGFPGGQQGGAFEVAQAVWVGRALEALDKVVVLWED